MKIHRFYTPQIDLKRDFWVKDEALLHQWLRVLRFRTDQKVVLFDGLQHDRLYRIAEIHETEAKLELITEQVRQLPRKNSYLLWALLKNDKNDWVLQKATELGISHFVPLLAERSEKTGFNIDRARKIVIEAAEQCGRSDIPTVREPMHVGTAIDELHDQIELYVCEQGSDAIVATGNDIGALIGPEGGWSDLEKKRFEEQQLAHLKLHDFTLRAETASIVAVAKLLQ